MMGAAAVPGSPPCAVLGRLCFRTHLGFSGERFVLGAVRP